MIKHIKTPLPPFWTKKRAKIYNLHSGKKKGKADDMKNQWVVNLKFKEKEKYKFSNTRVIISPRKYATESDLLTN